MAAAELLLLWRTEIVEELAAAQLELQSAEEAVRATRQQADTESRLKTEMAELVKKGVGSDPVASALRRRVEDHNSGATVSVKGAQLALQGIQDRVDDLEAALAQIDRSLRVVEPIRPATDNEVVRPIKRPVLVDPLTGAIVEGNAA